MNAISEGRNIELNVLVEGIMWEKTLLKGAKQRESTRKD